jgi:transcriptional regulator with XRE-family HTH domain
MGKGRTRLHVLRSQQGPRGLSQTQLARNVGIKRLRYWAIENGELEPTEDERKAVAAALHVKPSDIAWPEVTKARAS